MPMRFVRDPRHWRAKAPASGTRKPFDLKCLRIGNLSPMTLLKRSVSRALHSTSP